MQESIFWKLGNFLDLMPLFFLNSRAASLAQRQSASLLSWWSRVRSPQGATVFFSTRLFPKCTDCGEDSTVEHASNSCNGKMTEEERRIHTEEFESLIRKANIGESRELYNYLFWKMFKIEHIKEIGKKIRQMVMKMKTVITKVMLMKKRLYRWIRVI